MRKNGLLLFVIAAAFISIQAVNGQTKFEGKLVIESTGTPSWSRPNGKSTLIYYFKGDKVRVDMHSAEGESNIIVDKPENKVFIVMPGSKSYMEVSLNNGNKSAKTNDNKEKVKKTGKMKKINGYKSEKWIITDDYGTTEAWLAKGLGGFSLVSSPMNKDPKDAWEKVISKSGEIPMLIIRKDKKGKVTSRMETKSVEKKSLDDSFFEVPAGYKKME